MKKIIFAIFVFFGMVSSYSQEFTYGLALSTSYYDIDNERGVIYNGSLAQFPFGIGGYFDYNFKNNLGIKTSLIFNTATESYSQLGGNQFRIKQNNLTLTPHFKLDTKGDYNNGFYLVAGPRISVVLNEKDVRGNAPNGDLYKSTNFGIQVGFGFQLLKHFKFEAVGDYGLSNPLIVDIRSQTTGIYGNFLINLDSIVSK